jgi:hypothetical protein
MPPFVHDLHSSSRDESTQPKDKHMSKLTSVGEDETVLPDCDPNLERPQQDLINNDADFMVASTALG